MGSQAIDLSGGFVPKAGPPKQQGQNIDLSGGFVPKAGQPQPEGFASSYAGASGLSMLGHALMHPIDTAGTVLDAARQVVTPAHSVAEAARPMSANPNPIISSIGNAIDYSKNALQQGMQDYKQQGLSQQTRRDFSRAIPVIGPTMEKAKEQSDAGNQAGAAGTVFGLATGLVAPSLLGAGASKLSGVTADTLAAPLRSQLDEPIPGTSLTPRQRYASAQNLGVQLDAADATNHPVLTMTKAVNRDRLVSAPIYDRARANNLTQLSAATDNMLDQASPTTDLQARGSLVKGDLQANQQGLKNDAAAGFQALHEATGGAPVPGAAAVGTAARQMLEQNEPFWNRYPSMVPSNARSALQDMSKVDDTTSFPELQRLRSNVLELTGANNDLVKDDSTALLQQMAGHLDNAMTEKGLTPDQVPLFRAANAKWADLKATYDNPQSPMYNAVRTGVPENLANGVGGPNASSVQNLFARVSPEAQGAVQRSVAEKLIGTNATGDPRFQNFGTRLYAQPQGYRDELFTPQQNQTLTDVANATHALNTDFNPSGSAKQVGKLADFHSMVPLAAYELGHGNVGGAAAAVAAPLIHYPIAKLINSERFTNFLMKEPGAARGGFSAPPVLPVGGGGDPAKYTSDAYGPKGLDGYLDSQAAKSASGGKGLQGLDSLYTPQAAAPVDVGPKGARIDGVDGSDTTLHTPSGVLPAKYRLVESDDLVPSHFGNKGFKANPAFPEGVQPRDYENQRENQLRVIQNSQNLKPEMILSDTPTGTDGPPVATSDGVILGGTNRYLSTQLHYQNNGTAFKEMLAKKAPGFGFSADDVNGMDKPMVVREVTPENGQDGYKKLADDLNKPFTGSMAGSEKAVAMGKSLSPQTLSSVQSMIDAGPKGSSLRDILSDPSSANRFLQRMQSDGLVSSQERPQYLDGSDGGMTEEGKRLFERALLGKAVGDSYLMDAAPKSTLAKLGSSIGSLSSLGARGDEFNILPEVQRGIREQSKMATTGMNVDDHFAQQNMFDNDRPTPAEEQMTRLLSKGPNAVRDAFKSFADDARQSPEGQSSLLGMSGPSPEEAWIKAFGPILQRRGPSVVRDAPLSMPALRAQPNGKGISLLSGRPMANMAANPFGIASRGLYPGGDAA